MVMLTMGGIPWRYTFLEHLKHQTGIYFVIPGADRQAPIRHDSPSGNSGLVLLPHQSEFFHPDLVNAADAVIGKAGYSTVSEVHAAGIPFGYIGRSRFRETQTLTAFIEQEMKGLPIPETSFHDGQWLSSLGDLLEMPRIHRNGPNGADEIAGFICKLLAVSQS
jgi:UDP-N-acetylglucosamine:LPS N-acetylglucosamine transferase